MPRPAPSPWWLVLGGWLCACTSPGDPPPTSPTTPAAAHGAEAKSPPPGAADAGSTPTPQTQTQTKRWVDPPRTHLLLLRHAPDAPQLELLPLALPAAGSPTPGTTTRLPALPRPDWADHFTAVVSHGGQSTWAHASGHEGAYAVTRRDVDPTIGPTEVPAGSTLPAAMHMVGTVVLVGAGNTIGTVDFGTATPRWEQLHQRPEMQFKAYDLFARAGDWLVAIDDEVFPIYADTFTLDAKGLATHRAAWELPGVINGHYLQAALHRSSKPGGKASGTLWAVAGYGIMDGHGQDLTALTIEDDALTVDANVILNSTVMNDPPVLEEHVSRHTGKPEKLAFGADFTPWTGLAYVEPSEGPGQLLLAAGSRGLLVVPERFTPSTKAEAVDVGGECADVLVLGDRVLTLVAGPAPALLELRPTARGLEPGPRTPLPAAYDRFVR